MSVALIFLVAPPFPVPPSPERLPTTFPTLAAAPVAALQEGEGAATEGESAWHGSVNVGGNFSNGNSNSTSISVSADAERKVEENRYSAKLFYNFTEDREDDDTTQDNAGIGAQYDRFLNEKLYFLATADYFTDEVALLDARIAIGAGLGYQFEDTEEFTLRGELGPSYVDESFDDATPDNDYIAVRLAESVGWQINETVRLENDTEVLPSVDDSDDITGTSDTRIKVRLSESMVSTLQYVLNYDNTPAAGQERDDHRFVLTVGWTF